jgi:hypothetical protein
MRASADSQSLGAEAKALRAAGAEKILRKTARGAKSERPTRKVPNWSRERSQNPAKPDAAQIMEPIAHGLTPQQVSEVAAGLGSLESSLRGAFERRSSGKNQTLGTHGRESGLRVLARHHAPR